MHVTKCDVCSKVIGDNQEKVTLGYFGKEFFLPATHHMCAKCAKPIVAFIKKQGWDKRSKN